MIYSVHNPYTGVFDYFEAGPDTAINDDLPTPRFSSDITTPVGVPASFAGRPLPPSARQTGSGVLPVGSISNGQQGLWTGSQKSMIPSGLGVWADFSDRFTELLTIAAVCGLLYVIAKDWK
jgi:hypothetical protein